MNEFIDFLEEYKIDKEDEKQITKFKNKINEPIPNYKHHLANFKFTKGWFEKLDGILIELGYRALDADIDYIKKELTKIIHNTHINKIITTYNKIYKTNIKRLNNNHNYGKYSNINMVEIVRYLITHEQKIDWELFLFNDADIAVKYIIRHPEKIYWDNFSYNRSDIAVHHLIEQHPNNTDQWGFSSNENSIAVHYLLENQDKINWYWFSYNKSDIAVQYLIEHPDKIEWRSFSQNENINAVHYCIEHSDKIDWIGFSINTSDIAVNYLICNPDKILLDSFIYNKNDTAVNYLNERKIYSKVLIETIPSVEDLLNNQKLIKFGLMYHKFTEWKIAKFNELNWLRMSKMQL